MAVSLSISAAVTVEQLALASPCPFLVVFGVTTTALSMACSVDSGADTVVLAFASHVVFFSCSTILVAVLCAGIDALVLRQ
jgi:hypothetical protein